MLLGAVKYVIPMLFSAEVENTVTGKRIGVLCVPTRIVGSVLQDMITRPLLLGLGTQLGKRGDTMRMYQVYVCEHCGKESLSHDAIEECEAEHMGLTVAEKHTWDALKSAAKYFGSVVSTTNNEQTRAAYDNAIEKLVSFEQSHRIS